MDRLGQKCNEIKKLIRAKTNNAAKEEEKSKKESSDRQQKFDYKKFDYPEQSTSSKSTTRQKDPKSKSSGGKTAKPNMPSKKTTAYPAFRRSNGSDSSGSGITDTTSISEASD